MDIETLSKEWVQANETRDENSSENHWSIDHVIELHLDRKYDELWSFIKFTYKQNISNKVIEVLAAGPLEDLLSGEGEKYIDEIETLARKDPKFNDLLGGVWQNAMSNSLWERVCKARNNAW